MCELLAALIVIPVLFGVAVLVTCGGVLVGVIGLVLLTIAAAIEDIRIAFTPDETTFQFSNFRMVNSQPEVQTVLSAVLIATICVGVMHLLLRCFRD